MVLWCCGGAVVMVMMMVVVWVMVAVMVMVSVMVMVMTICSSLFANVVMADCFTLVGWALGS